MSIKYAVVQCVALWLALGAFVHARPSTHTKAGDLCKPQTIFCADGDGQSPRYLKCIHGTLVEGSCVNNSICVGSKDTTIFCAIDNGMPAKDTTAMVRVLPQSKQTALARPYMLPPPTPAVTGPPPLQLKHTLNPSPIASAAHGPAAANSVQWSPPQNLQSQPPNHLAVSTLKSTAPQQHVLPPPAPESQVWSYIQPPAASSVPQVTKPVQMLNIRPTSMFAASPAPIDDTEDNENVNGSNAADNIGGIAADDALSIIGSAIFSQHPELLSRSGAIAPDSEPTLQVDATAQELPATRQPQRPTVARGGLGVCTPGSFICEAHGLRPGYFACDSGGLALPASCGLADVCYQHHQVIVCGAPGHNF
ncbi:hypothetical protein GGH19_004630 [Coemansia sp. RSA 1807]|nr:hypothetical protein GGH19_004630 [Coemansia sp. RSA 1807]